MQSTRTESESSFVADSLAGGMLMMLGLTLVQRALGFFRGIWFCRMMDDTSVGQWAMAFGFLILIAPVMMLGLSGAMPRFVERYRQAGQLPAFIKRVMLGAWVGGALVFLAMAIAPQAFGWLVFRSPSDNLLIASLAFAILTLFAFNFTLDLVSSLRQVRLNSIMQFIQGVGFTASSIVALAYGGGVVSLLICFGGATIVGMLPGLWILRKGWGGLPVGTTPLDSRSMWKSLLPYAMALWTINLLTNLFELADRYMILHYTAGGEAIAQAAVGQYHSGRLVPTLIGNIALMYAGILMPYLAADWEAGRRREAVGALRRTLMIATIFFTAGAAITLMFAPWIFGTLLQGRYGEGLRLMPHAFVICIWGSLISLGQLHVWLNERGKWIGCALGVGIVINLVLNYLWLPSFGLDGAVWATVVSTGVVLIGVLGVMGRLEFSIDLQVIGVSMLPLALFLPPWTSLCVSVLILGLMPQARLGLVRICRDQFVGRLMGLAKPAV
ncbi:MAG TPA: spore cortex protein [Planctomycetaceae bacterium]|nr:spore cortex protein [Planctomycetaceae bacterium]